MSENSLSKDSLLLEIIKRYDHYIGTTNFKAGLLLSFLATVVVGLSLRIVTLKEEPSCDMIGLKIISVLTILTLIFSFVAAFQLFRATFPSTTSPSGNKSVIHFGDVAEHNGGFEGYYKTIESITSEEICKDIATQAYVLACIAQKKFKLLQSAIRIIKFALLPLLALTIIVMISSEVFL